MNPNPALLEMALLPELIDLIFNYGPETWLGVARRFRQRYFALPPTQRWLDCFDSPRQTRLLVCHEFWPALVKICVDRIGEPDSRSYMVHASPDHSLLTSCLQLYLLTGRADQLFAWRSRVDVSLFARVLHAMYRREHLVDYLKYASTSDVYDLLRDHEAQNIALELLISVLDTARFTDLLEYFDKHGWRTEGRRATRKVMEWYLVNSNDRANCETYLHRYGAAACTVAFLLHYGLEYELPAEAINWDTFWASVEHMNDQNLFSYVGWRVSMIQAAPSITVPHPPPEWLWTDERVCRLAAVWAPSSYDFGFLAATGHTDRITSLLSDCYLSGRFDHLVQYAPRPIIEQVIRYLEERRCDFSMSAYDAAIRHNIRVPTPRVMKTDLLLPAIAARRFDYAELVITMQHGYL